MDLGCVAGSSTGEAEEAVQVRLLGFVFLLGFQRPRGSFAPAGDVSVRGRGFSQRHWPLSLTSVLGLGSPWLLPRLPFQL